MRIKDVMAGERSKATTGHASGIVRGYSFYGAAIRITSAALYFDWQESHFKKKIASKLQI